MVYQLCLMKPFFEAGLKDLAVTSGYPSQSIHFSDESSLWEAMYQCMLQSFLVNFPDKQRLKETIANTLQEFEKVSYDKLALYSVIRSFGEERTNFD